MPTEKALYTPESRSVKMAGRQIQDVMDHFKELGKDHFMKQKRSAGTQRMYDAIARSPMASQLLSDGYPASFAYRVAQLEQKQLGERGVGADALALTLATRSGGLGNGQ